MAAEKEEELIKGFAHQRGKVHRLIGRYSGRSVVLFRLAINAIRRASNQAR